MTRKKQNNYYIDCDGVVHMELTRRGKDSLWTIFDANDLDRIVNFPYSWHADYNKNGHQFYVASTIYKQKWRELCGGNTIRLHVYLVGGSCKGKIVVDHINGDSLDNRRCNLRLADYTENALNRKSCNANNFTGFRNVSFVDGKYLVQLRVNGENLKFGPFDKAEEANAVAIDARCRYGLKP